MTVIINTKFSKYVPTCKIKCVNLINKLVFLKKTALPLPPPPSFYWCLESKSLGTVDIAGT